MRQKRIVPTQRLGAHGFYMSDAQLEALKRAIVRSGKKTQVFLDEVKRSVPYGAFSGRLREIAETEMENPEPFNPTAIRSGMVRSLQILAHERSSAVLVTRELVIVGANDQFRSWLPCHPEIVLEGVDLRLIFFVKDMELPELGESVPFTGVSISRAARREVKGVFYSFEPSCFVVVFSP